MTEEEMEQIKRAIKESENKEAYPFEFDVNQYKRDFATLMATLEEASALKETETLEEEVVNETKVSAWIRGKSFLKSRFVGYAGSAVAAATVTIVSTVAMNAIRKGGVFK